MYVGLFFFSDLNVTWIVWIYFRKVLECQILWKYVWWTRVV